MTGEDYCVILLLLAIACQVVLATFLYFIGRFYQMKFGGTARYNACLALIAAFGLMLAAILLGVHPFLAAMPVNLLALFVLIFCGIGLYQKMTGVRK